MDNNDVAKVLSEEEQKKLEQDRRDMQEHVKSLQTPKPLIMESVQPIWDGAAVESITDSLYDFEYLRLQELWIKYGIRGQGAKVYVIDSGIDDTHPGFKHHTDLRKKSFLSNEPSTKDGNGHGTWVCGKIAAQGTGIAPKCNLASFRTLDDSGSGSVEYSSDALKWILENDPEANVINMSLGAPSPSARQERIINKLVEMGVIVVVAAGNYNTDTPFYPGAYDKALTVAATDRRDVKAEFSNFGGQIDIAAPGVSCYGPYLGGKFRKMSGTSMATPIVSGICALGVSYLKNVKGMRSRPTIYQCVTRALFDTAKDLGAKGKDKVYGFGGINALAFMDRLSQIS